MVERFDLPRVPTHTPPNVLNHETAKWGLGGGLVGQIVASVITGLKIFAPATGMLGFMSGFIAPALVLGAGYVAAKYGSKIGMAEQARELAEGRTVREPSYINKGIVSGLSVGTAIGMALGLLTGGVGFAVGLGLLGAGAGSYLQKNQDQKDFDLATAQQEYEARQNGPKVPVLVPGKGVAMVQYKDSVSQEESQALEAKQDAGRQEHSHSQNVMASDAIPLEHTR